MYKEVGSFVVVSGFYSISPKIGCDAIYPVYNPGCGLFRYYSLLYFPQRWQRPWISEQAVLRPHQDAWPWVADIRTRLSKLPSRLSRKRALPLNAVCKERSYL